MRIEEGHAPPRSSESEGGDGVVEVYSCARWGGPKTATKHRLSTSAESGAAQWAQSAHPGGFWRARDKAKSGAIVEGGKAAMVRVWGISTAAHSERGRVARIVNTENSECDEYEGIISEQIYKRPSWVESLLVSWGGCELREACCIWPAVDIAAHAPPIAPHTAGRSHQD